MKLTQKQKLIALSAWNAILGVLVFRASFRLYTNIATNQITLQSYYDFFNIGIYLTTIFYF